MYILDSGDGTNCQPTIFKLSSDFSTLSAFKNNLGNSVLYRALLDQYGAAVSLTLSKIVASPTTPGLIYGSDSNQNKIFSVSNSSYPVPIAGSGSTNYADGINTTASFNSPNGMVINGTDIYIAETSNSVIRKLSTSTLQVSTFKGTFLRSFLDVQGLAFDANGVLHSIGSFPGLIHQITAAQTYSIYSGSLVSSAGTPNLVAKPQTAFESLGNGLFVGSDLFVVDTGSGNLQKIFPNGTSKLIAGYPPKPASTEGALIAGGSLKTPTGIAVDSTGNFYVSSTENHVILKVDVAGNRIKFFAGKVSTSGFTDGTALGTARFMSPKGLLIVDDVLFVADYGNNAIRIIDLINNKVSTLPLDVYSTSPSGPADLAYNAATKTLYVTDSVNNIIHNM